MPKQKQIIYERNVGLRPGMRLVTKSRQREAMEGKVDWMGKEKAAWVGVICSEKRKVRVRGVVRQRFALARSGRKQAKLQFGIQ